MRYGFDLLEFSGLRGQKIGILAHQASVTSDLEYSFVRIKKAGLDLEVIFAPEHGLYSVKQDQMEIEDGVEPITKTPIVSVYPPERWDHSVLNRIDVLIIDIFDIGARYYTYLWSATELIKATEGQKVIVCDRPNPIGRGIEGPIIDEQLFSFVGPYPIPIRHGMTPGELLLFLNDRYLKKDVDVVKMQGWNRGYYQGLWIPPSPNIPQLSTAIVYPGGCLIEGTNLSEGRGTTRPFEQIGAPWLEPTKVVEAVGETGGARLRPIKFQPRFSKYTGEVCNGIFVHVTKLKTFRPVAIYLEIIRAVKIVHPERFDWLPPPYEGVTDRMPFDLLIGKKDTRTKIESGTPIPEILKSYQDEIASFEEERERYLLY